MILLRVDPDDAVPPSQQLVAAFLDAIATGALRDGEQLPTVRALASQVDVNANTVKKSYRDLQKLGVVYGRNGRGVFVTARARDVATAVRLVETLTEFRKAASLAMRAGHVGSVLADELCRLVAEPPT